MIMAIFPEISGENQTNPAINTGDDDNKTEYELKEKSLDWQNHSLEKSCQLIQNFTENCPQKAGCYCMIGNNETLLYVGKAKNLKKRIHSYTMIPRQTKRHLQMIAQIEKITITITDTEIEALLLESNLIKKHQPRYNILLKDNKSMPCLFIRREHDYPQILKHRGKQKEKGNYFGPFPQGSAVNQVLINLQKIFLLRDCSDTVFARHKNQPCMRYQIKRCSAPCAGYISPEEYKKTVDSLQQFLLGNHDNVRSKIQDSMAISSANMEYERAAYYRDQLERLARITAFQKINIPGLKDADIIAIACDQGKSCIAIFFYRGGCHYGHRNYFPKHSPEASEAEIMSSFLGQFYSRNPPPPTLLLNHMPDDAEFLSQALASNGKIDLHMPMRGERKKIVQSAWHNAEQALNLKNSQQISWQKSLHLLQEKLQMAAFPKRIEIYDNSHIQGSYAIAAMVVAGEEGLMKQNYRKFNIQPSFGGDDYAMMHEVMTRRFTRYMRQEKKWFLHPNLLLIDGGKGQVSVVKSVLKALGVENVTLLGIAKGKERNAGKETFVTQDGNIFQLSDHDPLLFFLQNLRDEAHRYAIGAHRNRRSKENFINPLDEIIGIGSERKRNLLQHFGSAKSVASAALEDLQNTPGISQAMAKKIYHHFND